MFWVRVRTFLYWHFDFSSVSAAFFLPDTRVMCFLYNLAIYSMGFLIFPGAVRLAEPDQLGFITGPLFFAILC